jgi:hypothetical protein
MRWLAADSAERSASRARACACGHRQVMESLEIEGKLSPTWQSLELFVVL